MKHLIVYSEKNQALHYLFRKMQHLIIPSERIRCLIISSEKNELFFWRNNQACVFFWRNNEALHFSEEIMRRLIFSEEIKMCFVLLWRIYKEHFFIWRNKEGLHFIWRNNEANRLMSCIILIILYFWKKHQLPHYLIELPAVAVAIILGSSHDMNGSTCSWITCSYACQHGSKS